MTGFGPPPARGGPWSLYVHVPFCRSKCAYCDFVSVPVGARLGRETADAYVDAALGHLELLVDEFSVETFDTAYVGGGTPTILPAASLRLLLAGIEAHARGVREWTVEANPESLTADTLSILADSGVDRLSLGVQDPDDAVLARSGRTSTTSRDILRAFGLVASAWRGRFSADFIRGLPGQTPDGLSRGLCLAADAGARHLSVYDLTLERGTALERAARSGAVELPDEALDAELRAAVDATIGRRGFARYEVSNHAVPGEESLHNLNYWRLGAWLGVGPSASGSMPLADGGIERRACAPDLGHYLADPAGSATIEFVPTRTAAFEAVMMGMRTAVGVDSAAFAARFGRNPAELFAGSIARHPDLVRRTANGFAPTPAGLDLLNVFLCDCLGELDLVWPPGADAE